MTDWNFKPQARQAANRGRPMKDNTRLSRGSPLATRIRYVSRVLKEIRRSVRECRRILEEVSLILKMTVKLFAWPGLFAVVLVAIRLLWKAS